MRYRSRGALILVYKKEKKEKKSNGYIESLETAIQSLLFTAYKLWREENVARFEWGAFIIYLQSENISFCPEALNMKTFYLALFVWNITARYLNVIQCINHAQHYFMRTRYWDTIQRKC